MVNFSSFFIHYHRHVYEPILNLTGATLSYFVLEKFEFEVVHISLYKARLLNNGRLSGDVMSFVLIFTVVFFPFCNRRARKSHQT